MFRPVDRISRQLFHHLFVMENQTQTRLTGLIGPLFRLVRVSPIHGLPFYFKRGAISSVAATSLFALFLRLPVRLVTCQFAQFENKLTFILGSGCFINADRLETSNNYSILLTFELFQCDRTIYHLKTNRTPNTRLTRNPIPWECLPGRRTPGSQGGGQASWRQRSSVGGSGDLGASSASRTGRQGPSSDQMLRRHRLSSWCVCQSA